MANPNPSPETRYGQNKGNKHGKGPKKGAPNAGRPTLSLRHFLANLRHDAKTQLAIQAAARDHESRGFATALRVLSEYDEDRPAEKRELSGKVEVSVKFTRETKKRTSG